MSGVLINTQGIFVGVEKSRVVRKTRPQFPVSRRIQSTSRLLGLFGSSNFGGIEG